MRNLVAFPAAAVLLASLLLAPVAGRALDADFDGCAKKSGEAALAACTAFLARGSAESAKDRAIVYNNRGIEYSLQGKWPEAVADSTRAIELDPTFSSSFVNRGHVYERQGEDDKALADFNEAIRLDDKYHLSFYNRGIVYKKKREYDKAISDFSLAIALNPKYLNAFTQRGLAYEEVGKAALAKLALARLDFRAALDLSPGDKDASSYLERVEKLLAAPAAGAPSDQAWSDCGNKSGEEMIRACTAFLARGDTESAHDRAIAFYNRGVEEKKAGDAAKAVDDYSEAIKLNPAYQFAWNNRGTAYAALEDYDNAVLNYTEAMRLDPKDADPVGNRGLAYEKQGKLEAAVADFRAAVALNDGNRVGVAGIERVGKLPVPAAGGAVAKSGDGCGATGDDKAPRSHKPGC